MKKFIALLLALVMVLSMVACGEKAPAETNAPAQQGGEQKPVEEKPAEGEKKVEVVTYYCTIGAYLHILEEEIAKWNAGEGKEKGVEIQLTSNINDGSSAIELQFEAALRRSAARGCPVDFAEMEV